MKGKAIKLHFVFLVLFWGCFCAPGKNNLEDGFSVEAFYAMGYGAQAELVNSLTKEGQMKFIKLFFPGQCFASGPHTEILFKEREVFVAWMGPRGAMEKGGVGEGVFKGEWRLEGGKLIISFKEPEKMSQIKWLAWKSNQVWPVNLRGNGGSHSLGLSFLNDSGGSAAVLSWDKSGCLQLLNFRE